MSDSAEPIATVISGHTFTLDSRYVLTDSKILGKGSFGVVCTAYDTIRQMSIAIKRIRPYATDDWDAKHTLREIRLLKLLGPHPNIVSLYELSLFEAKTELYMMMELMDCDLHRVIQSKQPLSEKHHKCFIKQILEGVKAMHAIGVFHRDLKPGNILVSKDCQIRITDFGLARFVDEPTRLGKNEANPMTEYVVTRWYRCPELLISPKHPYSSAVDMWSLGCIVAELLKRKPIFPGKDQPNQLKLIFETFGFSNSDEMGFPIAEDMLAFFQKHYTVHKTPLHELIPDCSADALDMVRSMLTINPHHRPSAAQALQHPFLEGTEILFDYNVQYLHRPDLSYFDFESEQYSVPELRDMIHHEVRIAAANAYRFQSRGKAMDLASPSEAKTMFSDDDHSPAQQAKGGSQDKRSQGSTGSGSGATRRPSNYDVTEAEGPASQMPTQVRNNRADPHNPFAARK